jgi:tellurite resistance-related uncharacterized protein
VRSRGLRTSELTFEGLLHMKALPTNVFPYKRTPDFTESTVPAGLLRSHDTKEGVWGKIVVLEGTLLYRILEPEVEEILLSSDRCGVVEPTVRHEVVPFSGVRFYVEFHRGRVAEQPVAADGDG